jgi:hypothetical protein
MWKSVRICSKDSFGSRDYKYWPFLTCYDIWCATAQYLSIYSDLLMCMSSLKSNYLTYTSHSPHYIKHYATFGALAPPPPETV